MSTMLEVSVQGKTIVEFSLLAETVNKGKYETLVEISSDGRPTKLVIPIVLLAGQFQPRVVDTKI